MKETGASGLRQCFLLVFTAASSVTTLLLLFLCGLYSSFLLQAAERVLRPSASGSLAPLTLSTVIQQLRICCSHQDAALHSTFCCTLPASLLLPLRHAIAAGVETQIAQQLGHRHLWQSCVLRRCACSSLPTHQIQTSQELFPPPDHLIFQGIGGKGDAGPMRILISDSCILFLVHGWLFSLLCKESSDSDWGCHRNCHSLALTVPGPQSLSPHYPGRTQLPLLLCCYEFSLSCRLGFLLISPEIKIFFLKSK